MTEEDMFAIVTHAHCVMCDHQEAVDTAGLTINNGDDWDDLIYEAIDCCDDPVLDPYIHSDHQIEALGDDVEHEDYKVPAGPATPFRPASDHDTWRYPVNELLGL